MAGARALILLHCTEAVEYKFIGYEDLRTTIAPRRLANLRNESSVSTEHVDRVSESRAFYDARQPVKAWGLGLFLVVVDLLDAPTALAACCGFDLCHNYFFIFFIFFVFVFVRVRNRVRRTYI